MVDFKSCAYSKLLCSNINIFSKNWRAKPTSTQIIPALKDDHSLVCHPGSPRLVVCPETSSRQPQAGWLSRRLPLLPAWTLLWPAAKILMDYKLWTSSFTSNWKQTAPFNIQIQLGTYSLVTFLKMMPSSVSPDHWEKLGWSVFVEVLLSLGPSFERFLLILVSCALILLVSVPLQDWKWTGMF